MFDDRFLLDMQVLESQHPIGKGVTVESWFIRKSGSCCRTELYKAEDGSVVAYQDWVGGKWGELHIELQFLQQNHIQLNDMEPELKAIIDWAGVSLSKVKTFDMGR